MRTLLASLAKLGLWTLLAWGCGPGARDDAGLEAGGSEASVDVDAVVDARPEPPAVDAGDGVCAQSFGSALTADFGRLDGTVRAVVRPGVEGCGRVNGTHLVLQLTMRGAVYRVVINVESSQGTDRRVLLRTLTHPLPSPAFSEGWHPGQRLDYVSLLGVHADAFTPYERDALVAEALRSVRVGARVAVYATSGAGRPDSVHLVHRNQTQRDGAVVLDPDGPAPQWLLFRFADQDF